MLDTRTVRIVIISTFTALLLIISAIVLIANYQNKISQKPDIEDSSEKQNLDAEQFKWYIKFSVKDQRATAYVEEAYAPKAANGGNYFIGGTAMHPLYPINSGGDPLQAVIPFGTTLYLEEPLEVQGSEISSLQVMDTGDVYYGLWPEYPYWLDIYFGTANYYNRLDASNFGTQLVNYYWIEEWR